MPDGLNASIPSESKAFLESFAVAALKASLQESSQYRQKNAPGLWIEGHRLGAGLCVHDAFIRPVGVAFGPKWKPMLNLERSRKVTIPLLISGRLKVT